MYTQAEISLMQEMLVTSVSCGDAKLQKLLQDNVAFLWCVTAACKPEVQYLNTQLELINLAQGFTRNMIDTTSRRSSSRSGDKYDSAMYRDTQSQRTGQGTANSWSKATTFQQFQRDSEQHARSQSDSTSDTTGRASSYLWDRSQQVSSGWANTYDISKQKSHDESLSQSGTCIDRDSESAGGTPAGPVALDFGSVVAPGVNFQDLGSWSQSVVEFASTWLQSVFWGGTEVKAPTEKPTWWNANSGYASNFNPPVSSINCPTEPDEQCPAMPSYGGGYTDSWNVSVAIPFVGTVSSSWREGYESRQSFTCHSGFSTLDGNSFEVGKGRGEVIGQAEGKTEAHTEGENVHDRHRSASAFRNSEGHATAMSTDTMRAHGESHNGSDSSAHGESQAGNQATAYGVHHMEGHGKAFSHSESEGESKYWSQIFRSLADMWQRVWKELTEMERMLSLSSQASFGKICPPYTACEAKNTGFMARRSVPALGPVRTTPFYAMGRIQ